jgi:hypothetical protein
MAATFSDLAAGQLGRLKNLFTLEPKWLRNLAGGLEAIQKTMELEASSGLIYIAFDRPPNLIERFNPTQSLSVQLPVRRPTMRSGRVK